MSSKKDKLLESAQKYIAKGQMDRAIKEYVQIVAIDQSDIRQRQKLAELLSRVNRRDEAVAEYEKIAKHYTQNHFFLKAIAVYKQIQKLTPDDINISLSLASLYSKQGLIVNALSEYSLVADHFQKGGMANEALKVIESMVEADPDNLNSHLRLAEACFDAGQKDRAYQEFTSLALLYRKGGDEAGFEKISNRVAKLFPDHADFTMEVLSAQVRGDNAAGAIPLLKRMIDRDKSNLKAWELLAECYLSTGESQERRETLHGIIDNFPERLSAVQSLVQSYLDEGDVAGTLAILKTYQTFYINNGTLKSLEKAYATLREMSPNDTAILQALKELYDGCGEKEKLASLSCAETPAESSEVPEVEEPEIPAAPTPPAAPEIVETPIVSSTPEVVSDMSWEEEIDLSIIDEEGTDNLIIAESKGNAAPDTGYPAETVAVEEPTAEADEAAVIQPEVEEPQAEQEESREVSLEFEETDFSDSDWLAPLSPEESVEVQELPDTDMEFEIPAELPESKEMEAAASEEIPLQEIKEPTESREQEKGAESSSAGRRRKKYGLDEFSEFKKGLDKQLDKGDTETHYNLGIAYKEMGLYDDAVSEFEIAAVDPQRRIDCMTLQGICHRDKGDFAGAEEMFKNTLAMTGLTGEERVSISYELAFLCETLGRKEEAVQFYREVLSINPEFRDAIKKIEHLTGDK